MRTLVVLLLLGAGPRTDGRYVSEELAKAIKADTYASIDVGIGASFSKAKVKRGYGMEDDEKPWRWKNGALELDGVPVKWAELDGGVVESDLMRPGEVERLVFLPGVSEASLGKKLEARHRAALLRESAGTWKGGGHELVLGAKSTWDGKPVDVRTSPCSLSCEHDGLCVDLVKPKRSFMPSAGKLAEVALEGLCGELKTGVERVDGGLVLSR